MAIHTVIFDSDGTLFDTNDQHVEAWRRAFASLGYKVEPERISQEIGKGGDQLVPAILGEHVSPDLVQMLAKRHTQAFYELLGDQPAGVYPGAKELLTAVRQKGVRTVLATSSKREELEAIERSSGMPVHEWVDELVTADDAQASKPAPDLVTAAVQKSRSRPNECLMVGDTPYDAEAARQAGVPCVGLLSGRHHDDATLRDAGVWAVYGNPGELLVHLDEVLGRSVGTA